MKWSAIVAGMPSSEHDDVGDGLPIETGVREAGSAPDERRCLSEVTPA